jgi:hypothetical protein
MAEDGHSVIDRSFTRHRPELGFGAATRCPFRSFTHGLNFTTPSLTYFDIVNPTVLIGERIILPEKY